MGEPSVINDRYIKDNRICPMRRPSLLPHHSQTPKA